MQTKAQNSERANIIAQIDTLNKRYQNALIKNADGELDCDDFQELKKLTRSDPPGARTQDPILKRDVLYLLS